MTSGLNQDVDILGKIFHLQTEVIGTDPASIRTEVFVGGKLVATREVAIDPAGELAGDVRALMKDQHTKIHQSLLERAKLYQDRQSAGAPARRPVPASPDAALEARRQLDLTPPSAAGQAAIDMGLRVRRLFEEFALRIGAAAPAGELSQRLRKAAGGLRWIRQSPTFPEIRVDEQIKINLLQDEIDEWLRSDRAPERGARIWSELVTFNDYLAEINNRSELAAFDRDLIRWAVAKIRAEGMSEKTVKHLELLHGRDRELDGLLDRPGTISTDRWITVLGRVLAEIAAAAVST